MDEFRITAKALQEECKEDATGMQRNFCVLTLEVNLSPATMKWASKFENHRVLVGS